MSVGKVSVGKVLGGKVSGVKCRGVKCRGHNYLLDKNVIMASSMLVFSDDVTTQKRVL